MTMTALTTSRHWHVDGRPPHNTTAALGIAALRSICISIETLPGATLRARTVLPGPPGRGTADRDSGSRPNDDAGGVCAGRRACSDTCGGEGRRDRSRLTLRLCRDPAQHAGEDQAVERKQGIPVRQPGQSARLEQGRLPDNAAVAVTVHLELEPRSPGYLHLRP